MTPALASRVVTIGETMALMRAPNVGSLAHLPSVDISIGGAESNLAIGLQRLGIPTTWIGRVGADELGDRVAREIRAEGVDAIVVVDHDHPTGLMIKSHPTRSSARVTYYRSGSAGSHIASEDVPADVIENADLLHISGITTMLGASAQKTIENAVNRAVAAGTQVSLDVNYRATLAPVSEFAARLRPVLPHVDFLFGGPEELAMLAHGADVQDRRNLLKTLMHEGPMTVVMKNGAKGATAIHNDQVLEVPAITVEVVDTVGAGDAFVAGFLSAHLENQSLPDCLSRAVIAGASVCTESGDWEGAIKRSELDMHRSPTSIDPVTR